MRQYIIRRLLLFPVTVLIITLAVFFMVRAIPGDIVDQKLENNYSEERAAELRAHLGLDQPFWVQYPEWITGLLRGDFGRSMVSGRPVQEEMLERLPVTLQLGAYTLLIAVGLGIPAGAVAAVRQGSLSDHSLRLLSIVGLAIPTFWLATLALVIPSITIGWSPKFGYVPFTEDPWTNFQQLIVPAAIGAAAFGAILLRITRVQMLEVMRQDFIRTARAKGLTSYDVVVRHALKNAMIPVVTVVGLSLGSVVSGSVFLEQIFSLPGLGRYAVSAVAGSDYPAIQAFVVMTGVVFVLVNLVVDLLYAVLDPRIRYT